MVGKNISQYPSQIQNKGLEGFWLTNKKKVLYRASFLYYSMNSAHLTYKKISSIIPKCVKSIYEVAKYLKGEF